MTPCIGALAPIAASQACTETSEFVVAADAQPEALAEAAATVGDARTDDAAKLDADASVAPSPPDVAERVEIVCNDAALDAAEDAPIACAPPPSDYCIGPDWAVGHQQLNWTCDPGGVCLYRAIVIGCQTPGCTEHDGDVDCPQYYTP